MTTVNTERIAKGWALIAEGAMELSLAYDAIDPVAARATVPDRVPTAPAGSAAGSAPLPPAAQSLQEQHVETVLAQCPDHQVPWTVKPAGISKVGKSYNAFWRCNQMTDGTYCAKRPVKAWADKHPISEGVAA